MVNVKGQLSKIWEVSCDWSVFRKGISYSEEQTLVGENKSPQDVCEGGYHSPSSVMVSFKIKTKLNLFNVDIHRKWLPNLPSQGLLKAFND